MWVCAKLHQLCLTLCDPVDYSPPGFSVSGILQAKIWEWVSMPSSRGSSLPRDQTSCFLMSPALADGFFTTEPPGNPQNNCRKRQSIAEPIWKMEVNIRADTTILISLQNVHQSVQFNSVSQSCPTLCNPMNHSTPGLPVHHHLPEFTQTHIHQVGDAIQPSHPLSSPSPPALNPSQHQSLFQWVNSSREVAKVLEFQL